MDWRNVVRYNPWLVPAIGGGAIVVSALTAGPIWALFTLYLVGLALLIAWNRSRTFEKRGGFARPAQTLSIAPGRASEARHEPEAWNNRSGADLTLPLDLVPEMSDSAQGDSIPLPERRPRFRPGRRPILDALVASTQGDPEGVRRALKPWVGQAGSPNAKAERQAQLHYWLFRAGETGELDKLKALAAAHPNLPEVTLYLHLAHQDYDELWS